MKKQIEALRKQPREVRIQYAFVGALLITGLIAFIWTLSLSARLGEDTSDTKAEVPVQKEAERVESFNDILDTVRSNVRDTVEQNRESAKQEESTSTENTPPKQKPRTVIIETSSSSKSE